MKVRKLAISFCVGVSLCCAGTAYSLSLTPGSLLGVGGSTHILYQYDFAGNVTGTLSLTDTFSAMTGVGVLGGSVFVMDVSGKVANIDLTTGGTISSFAATGNEGLGDDGTNLLVLDFIAGAVRRYTPGGTLVGTVSIAGGGTGIDGTAARMFVAQHSGADAGSIRVYDSAGTYLSTTSLGLPGASLSALGYDSTNSTYWVATGFGDDRIRQYDGSGNLLANFAAGDDWINGLDVVPGAAVPEPASLLLLGTGVVGMIGNTVRKRRKSSV